MDTYRIKEEYHKLFHAPHMNRIWVKSKLFDWFEDADDEDVKIHQATIEMFEKVEERIHLRRVPESHDICKIIGGDIKVFGNKDMIIMEKAINGDLVEKPVKLDGNFKITNNTEQTFFVNTDNNEILITELNSNKQPKTFTEDDVITLHWEYEKELLNTNPIPFNQWIKKYRSSGAKNGSVTDNESMIDGSLKWPKTTEVPISDCGSERVSFNRMCLDAPSESLGIENRIDKTYTKDQVIEVVNGWILNGFHMFDDVYDIDQLRKLFKEHINSK